MTPQAAVIAGALVVAFAFAFARRARTRVAYVNHAMTRGYVRARAVSAETVHSSEDVELAARLAKAYRAAMGDRPPGARGAAADMWDVLARDFHVDLIAALERDDPETLAGLLRAAFRERFTVGIGGPWHIESKLGRRRSNRYFATICADRVVSLAEALGALPLENPEQPGGARDSLYLDVGQVVARIEERLGIELPSKGIGGFAGIPLNGGFLGFRTCEHAYVAHRLRELARGRADDPAVCEIGGGYGGAAYYAWKMGIRRYTIFDLPHVNVIQGYYLAKALSGAAVSLFGESPSSGGIAILPHWRHAVSPAKAFDVALNQDSFAELTPAAVAEYLAGIRRATRASFLSINQEAQAPSGVPGDAQIWVSRMVDEAGGFLRVQRAPYWIRAGYVEEVYEIA